MSDIQTQIDQLVKSNDVVLFMKGTADQPQCGFSSTVVRILDLVNAPFKDINVLANMEVREGIKEYSNWPTIPQLYIKGEFIGGCDIVREMYEAGELTALLAQKGIA
jgi:monothiol glutaredoxin